MPVVAGPPQGHGPSTFDKSELSLLDSQREIDDGIYPLVYGLADIFYSEDGRDDGIKLVVSFRRSARQNC
jgi:hypothetical protein